MSTTTDSDNAAMRRQIAELEARVRRMTADLPPQERDELSAAQARADAVAAKFGTTASAPQGGETAFQYRRRLLGHFAKYSPKFKGARVEMIDPTALSGIEEQVYADAARAAQDPASYKPGELRAIQERDPAGRLVTRFVGDPLNWMRHFQGGGGAIGRIKDPRTK